MKAYELMAILAKIPCNYDVLVCQGEALNTDILRFEIEEDYIQLSGAEVAE